MACGMRAVARALLLAAAAAFLAVRAAAYTDPQEGTRLAGTPSRRRARARAFSCRDETRSASHHLLPRPPRPCHHAALCAQLGPARRLRGCVPSARTEPHG